MKPIQLIPTLFVIALLSACAGSPPAVTSAPQAGQQVEALPPASAEAATVPSDPGLAPSGPVPASALDPAGLGYVREEEKLARDVYLFLYARWGLPVFENIAASEQTHTEAVASLLASYGLEDPAAGAPAGQFRDADLQSLYDQLTARGGQSLAEALKVAAAVEEIDILDLQARLEASVPADIRLVYGNLLAGSYNHLAAFTSSLLRQSGETYQPAYMTVETYQLALSLAASGGSGRGNGNGFRGGQP